MNKRLATLLIALLAAAAPAFASAAPTESQVQGIAAAKAEYAVGKKAIDREDWDGAIVALRSAERLDPGSADVQNLLGFAHRQKGEVEAAFKFYKKALELDPYHRGAHEYLGKAYLMQSEPEKAKALLANLQQVCPDRCPERDSLARAIADWDPWKRASRTGRGY